LSQAPAVFIAILSGLKDRPAIVRQGGEAFGLHVFIKPLGVRAILGVPSIELASRVAPRGYADGASAFEERAPCPEVLSIVEV